MSDPVDFLSRRALPFGYTADTAPAGMRWVYDALAPAPGTLYGDVLPVKREADGRIGFAMPNVMREGLLGLADLLSGTETDELTGRGAQSITMGGLGAGMTLAPRGTLAAGGARGRATPDLPMDRASQLSRARETGFQPDLKLYQWTDKPDFPAFAYGEPRAKSLGLSQPGFWAAEDPRYLDHMARLVGRENSQGGRVIPLFARFSKPARIDDVAGLTHQDVYFNIRNAWGDGYDAIRFGNYNTLANGLPTPTSVFRDPNQLRSPFARFDPARRDSADLLAGVAVPGGPAPVLGVNVRPRVDESVVPNELRPLNRRVY
jgi:hypothetical protein